MVQAKARLVARRFKQREGIDFFETLPRRLRRLVFVCWALLRAS